MCVAVFQFINDRLDMLNTGIGFSDLFEQECLVHADKLNSQTRYNEWLGKMKVTMHHVFLFPFSAMCEAFKVKLHYMSQNVRS